MNVFSFENKDKNVRESSSAGGLFTALADKVLANGGAVYGVAFNSDWRIEHRRVDNNSDLSALRGSKYVFTDISKCFKLIAADIEYNRPILIVGTPCQIAIVRKKFPIYDNALLVEVVCHGAPQQKYWDMYLDELLQSQGKNRTDIASINFRDKTKGWKNYSIRVDFKDGCKFIQNHKENPYITAFIYDYSLRQGCTHCPFKHPNSQADISMGDFWGIETLVPELDNNLGTTLAIANTERGKDLLNELAEPLQLSVEQVSQKNPAIVKAPNTPPNKYLFEKIVDKKGFILSTKRIVQPILRSQRPKLSSRIKALIYPFYRRFINIMNY